MDGAALGTVARNMCTDLLFVPTLNVSCLDTEEDEDGAPFGGTDATSRTLAHRTGHGAVKTGTGRNVNAGERLPILLLSVTKTAGLLCACR